MFQHSLKASAGLMLALTLQACGGGGTSTSAGDSNAGAITPPTTSTPTPTPAPTPVPTPTPSPEPSPEPTQPNDPMAQALATGDAGQLDADQIIDAALVELTRAKSQFNDVKRALFQLDAQGQHTANSLNSIHWNPTHDSALLQPTTGLNDAVLISNASNGGREENRSLAIAGIASRSNARYLVMGGNPFRNHQRDANLLNEQMHQFMANAITWLTGGQSDQPLKLVIAHLDQSYYFPDDEATRNWLREKFDDRVSFNASTACDGAALAACLDDWPDLLVISQAGASAQDIASIEAAVQTHVARGLPVLYLHHDGDLEPLGKALFGLLNVQYERDNYWWKLLIDNGDGADTYNSQSPDITAIASLLEKLRHNAFTLDLSGCDDKNCPDTSGYNSEFLAPAQSLQSLLQQRDSEKFRLFEIQGYTFEKLLVLLGDKYRGAARFPMDKNTTARADFLKSLYADMSHYNSRTYNPVQPDMGNFSRSDFSHITPATKRITLTAKPSFRAAGVYVIPGQTVRVTRLDNSTVKTHLFINSLRSGATHEFQNNGYKRPRYLTSPRFAIAPGETVTLTSAYGGPLQVAFDDRDQRVEFQFENIGLHAFWQSDADSSRFSDALTRNEFDWAELVTPGFEVHSTAEKMQETLEDSHWKTAAGIANATMHYVHNLPHALAGFTGPGIDRIDEISDFADAQGWQQDAIDKVKHMNADQANCGSGCSGNPYDAYWAFDPVGHGDLHELGHGLERSRFRFAGWDGHASTNFYSYYSKSRFYRDTGIDPSCQKLPFRSLFDTLQASRQSEDPAAYMREQSITAWNQGVAIYIQLMMAIEAEGVLQDGWHLLGRLHVLEREFNRAIKSDEQWLAMSSSLGFTQYTRAQASTITNNDWLLIALSKVSQRDLRNYLAMWGLDFGSDAASQVASLNLESLPLRFYASEERDYCLSLNQPAVTVDGNNQWPTP